MRALLLSGYAAGSHRYWRAGLERMFPDWQWQVEELPARHFAWRVRGNPLHWSQGDDALDDPAADMLLATSMVDLATLRGLVPGLAGLPTGLYFHENQFDYPAGRGRHGNLEAQMVSLYSALAADQLYFNSDYNRQGFLEGVDALLAGMPDLVPDGVAETLADRSMVLPVPLLPFSGDRGQSPWPEREGRQPLRLLWCGRFEYDKGGDRLLAALARLEATGLDYQLALAGQRFRELPPPFAEIQRRFTHRVVHLGYLESVADYQALLRGADLVVSTALHEFQGIAILEAVSAGCVPLLPSRQAYPELYPADYLYPSQPEDPAAEAEGLVRRLLVLANGIAQGEIRAPDVSGYALGAVAPRYRAAFEALTG